MNATLPARPAPPLASVAALVSVVVPAFNEAEALPLLHARLAAVLDGAGERWELIVVDDGSRDATSAVAERLRAADPRVALLALSRNFGKEIALTAGLDHARGAAVVLIDADLQDPPELIPAMLAAWRDGNDMVYAERADRASDHWLKRATAAAFYRAMRHFGPVELPAQAGDFRLLGRNVVDALAQLRERHRFMKGLYAWVGFRSVGIPCVRAARAAGRTKWNYWALWNLALEAITGFSVLPLKLASYLGLAVAGFAAVFGGQLVARTVLFGNKVAGYPSLMAVVLFLGGVQLITLGVIGEYLGRVFNETKRRPLYLVARFDRAEEGVVGLVPGTELAADS
ncbi:MAG: glycosyltransferase family 2 protein [Rhodospirillales bacterium]|nr:glycosyltransferase family 2 protein [Rhodospirillales bacterium]